MGHFFIKNCTYRRNCITFCDADHLAGIEGELIFYRCEERVDTYSLLRKNADKTEKERLS